jgi:hypothetical protein
MAEPANTELNNGFGRKSFSEHEMEAKIGWRAAQPVCPRLNEFV